MISDYEYYGYPYMISTKIGEEKRKKIQTAQSHSKRIIFFDWM